METALAKPVLIALLANIVMVEAAVAFAPNPKQKQATTSAQLKPPLQKAVYIPANVKHLPKKGRGVKETVGVMAIVGSIK